MQSPRIVVALLVSTFAAVNGFGQIEGGDLSKLSVDDLMNAEVTSVARRGQKLSDTPAAVFVITQDDIQRSGATTIAEVLRIVPGLDVASVDGNIWAISARGFNGRWANKLLVMIDGRTVFSPLFSGVYWDIQDTMLEDIERIEVIRGPGGTLWGANAVNGIINIITRNAIETQGTLVTAGAGSKERLFSSVRAGTSVGDDFHFRVFGKSYDRGASRLEDSTRGADAWNGYRAGFRADWVASARDNVSVQGDVYRGSSDEVITLFSPSDPLHGGWSTTNRPHGGDVLMKWTQTQSTRSETTVQVYGNYGARPSLGLVQTGRELDFDFQHQLKVGTSNELVWGAGYRRNSAHTSSALDMVEMYPASPATDLFSAFVQDEIRLPHSVSITFGSKVQSEHLYGVQFQPTLRALWRPNDQQTLWGAATRAVRIPGWIERNSRVNIGAFPGDDGQPVEIILNADDQVRAEHEVTYELGYRWAHDDRFSIDTTAFYERLTDIINYEPEAPYRNAGGQLTMPYRSLNEDDGNGRGLEIATTARLTDRWDISAGYAWLRLQDEHGGGQDNALFDDSPRHQVQLRSFFTLTPRLELDTSAYYVGRLETQGTPAYVRLDARLAWHPTAALEISLVGQNLGDDKHREYVGAEGPTATPVNRSFYGKVKWRF